MPSSITPTPPGHVTRGHLDIVSRVGLRFFLAEQLLEARHTSWLPTNGAGPDEDVNIYLALMLDRFVGGNPDATVTPGLSPLLMPPDRRQPPATRADRYRANADHRFLYLGLFHCGENQRRRAVPWGLTAPATRARDLAVARTCYEAAADLLARSPGRGGALAEVLFKLSKNGEDYVQVLGVLAVRRLGLGARLNGDELAALAGGGMSAEGQDPT